MPSRARRALIALTILGGGFLYLTGATHFEQQTIAAQAPRWPRAWPSHITSTAGN